MTDTLKASLFRRHLMFFALKQFLFICITIAVFTVGFFLFAAVAAEYFDSITKGSNVNGCIENMITFFVGLFLVLMFGVIILFALAMAASMLASFLVNYLISEMDVVQRKKTFGQKLGHSIIPPLAGIGAVMLTSAILVPLSPPEATGYIGGLQLLLVYFPVNYYFDKKFYMEGIVKE